MTESSPVRNPETSPTRDLLNAVRDYLHGWRGIAILAGVAMIAGLAFNWSWLVAAGIAPVLLSLLPCAAMCALGLCMNRMVGRSCSTDTSAPPTSRSIGADDTPIPPREIPSLSPSDPEPAIVGPAVASGNPKSQQERKLTDA